MNIDYQVYHYNLQFSYPIIFYSPPSYIIRNLLGKHLHTMNCIFPNMNCEACSIRFQCAYSRIFETPIEKDNTYLKGRNRAAHPFVLYSPSPVGKSIIEIELDLVLMGNAIGYFPYVHYALVRGGEKGIFKERHRYKITSVTANRQELMQNGDNISLPQQNLTWQLNQDSTLGKKQKLLIEIKTPLRIKKDGRYYSDISLNTILNAGFSRLKLLSGLYGETDGEATDVEWNNYSELSRHLKWVDYSRYSSRQQRSMKLGGVVGYIEAEGEFSQLELSVLKGAEIFHIGKNTGFGLGKVKVSL